MYKQQPVNWPANAPMPTTLPASSMIPFQTTPAAPGQGTVIIPNTGGSMAPPPVPSGVPISNTGATFVPVVPREESYVENILRMNLGKVATIYMTYENNSEWNAKIFKGVLEAAGRDHIIISDPTTGRRYLLLTLNLDYITFDEPINYNLPFGSGTNPALRFR
ncbi:spore coat protein GerQ [Cohnella sp. REN36]|uniref:spore coat protein GerQ n=1 Tax=Cohnella sp. REN36 TaxID=2887347 RepID=UPI001D1351AE|nr:spore coat protein GerQ [Cohnella sp. REN36]MCC3377483.1 spore coat protein GerQ [Cohnella sp. REN36]